MSFRCPTRDEILRAALALLPRGRAWQNHEGSPEPGIEPGFNGFAYSPEGFATQRRRQSILWQYWASVADVFAFMTRRLCDLRWEFWCATQSETRDLWMAEYGLPDGCDPFPDLCAKVAAIGGTRCEYYQEVAARAGWSLICMDGANTCGSRPSSFNAKAGRARPGKADTQGHLRVIVDLRESPAYTGAPLQKSPKAGRFKAGRRLTCQSPAPNLTAIECLLARVVHAEIQIIYEAVYV